MGKQGKYMTIVAVGILLIVVLGIAFTGNRRERGADGGAGSGMETGAGSGAESGAGSGTGTGAGSGMGTGAETDAGVSEKGGADGLEEYMKEQDVIMDEMMKDMENVPKTGSAAVDFLNGMIPHHESAVSMSESYLKNGAANGELKQLAEAIIEQQSEEILEMKAMAERILADGTKDEEAEAAYLEEYEKLFEDSHSHMAHGVVANVDRAFADGMIMHHQMAVDMAKAILNHTDDEDVKKMAQDMIDLQEEEIGRMQEIVKNNGL